MNNTLEDRKREMARWGKCLDRHWDKVDNEPDWNAKDRIMYSRFFVGSALKYISVMEQYITALENRVTELEAHNESVSEVD